MTHTHKIFLLAVLIFVQALPAQTGFDYKKDLKKLSSRTADSKDPLYYNKLLTRFNANDTTLSDYEVLALMVSFTNRPEYRSYEDMAVERKIYYLNESGRYRETLDTSLLFLKTHPLSQQALIETSYAYHKLEKPDSSDLYMYRFRRIMMAMDFSGNGKDKPIFAMGPADGQNYIHKYLRAKIGSMGSGKDNDGNFVELLEAKYADGSSEQLSFVIQHAMDRMLSSESMRQIEELESGKDKGKKKKK